MSWFAFSIWAWQATGEATTLAMVQFYAFVPTLLFSPFAGALVDRWNKKLVMALSDFGTALATAAILALYLGNLLQVWHLYVAAAFAGAFTAFQFPAYTTATVLMLKKDQYSRAEGMLGLTQAIPGIMAPLLAAALISKIGFNGILTIDLITFLAAFATILMVFIPKPAARRDNLPLNLWRESLSGFRYIYQRSGLRALVLLFMGGNFFEGMGTALIVPMILARTNNNAVTLGNVQSIGAVGGIIGGALISIWGGPKRRILGIVLGWTSACILGLTLMGVGGNWIVWAVASFFFAFFVVFVNSSEQAIWQTKVDPAIQGRVSATRLLLIQVTYLVSMPLAGWLADNVFEPGMTAGGSLSMFTWLVGSGPGAGMALILVLAGLGGALIILAGYSFRTVRNIEDLLTDYDGNPPPVMEKGTEGKA